MNRREFVNHTGTFMSLGIDGLRPNFKQMADMKSLTRIRIKNVDLNFEREPLFPYRFKGSVITEGCKIADSL